MVYKENHYFDIWPWLAFPVLRCHLKNKINYIFFRYIELRISFQGTDATEVEEPPSNKEPPLETNTDEKRGKDENKHAP